MEESRSEETESKEKLSTEKPVEQDQNNLDVSIMQQSLEARSMPSNASVPIGEKGFRPIPASSASSISSATLLKMHSAILVRKHDRGQQPRHHPDEWYRDAEKQLQVESHSHQKQPGDTDVNLVNRPTSHSNAHTVAQMKVPDGNFPISPRPHRIADVIVLSSDGESDDEHEEKSIKGSGTKKNALKKSVRGILGAYESKLGRGQGGKRQIPPYEHMFRGIDAKKNKPTPKKVHSMTLGYPHILSYGSSKIPALAKETTPNSLVQYQSSPDEPDIDMMQAESTGSPVSHMVTSGSRNGNVATSGPVAWKKETTADWMVSYQTSHCAPDVEMTHDEPIAEDTVEFHNEGTLRAGPPWDEIPPESLKSNKALPILPTLDMSDEEPVRQNLRNAHPNAVQHQIRRKTPRTTPPSGNINVKVDWTQSHYLPPMNLDMDTSVQRMTEHIRCGPSIKEEDGLKAQPLEVKHEVDINIDNQPTQSTSEVEGLSEKSSNRINVSLLPQYMDLVDYSSDELDVGEDSGTSKSQIVGAVTPIEEIASEEVRSSQPLQAYEWMNLTNPQAIFHQLSSPGPEHVTQCVKIPDATSRRMSASLQSILDQILQQGQTNHGLMLDVRNRVKRLESEVQVLRAWIPESKGRSGSERLDSHLDIGESYE